MNLKIKRVLSDAGVLLTRLTKGVDRASVLFESFDGKSYSDNPRAISEKLHEMYPDVKISWLFRDVQAKKNVVPDYVTVIDRRDKKAYMRALATSGTVILNFPLTYFRKSKKQLVIQTNHGDRGFKKVYLDSPFSKRKPAESIPGFCDLGVVGSDFGRDHLYMTAYDFKGRFIEKGTPRCDRLIRFDPEEAARIRESLSIAPDKGILLYAPTLRRESHDSKTEQKAQELNIASLLDRLEEAQERGFICLVRAHPNVVGLTGYGSDSRLMNVSAYEDMADLLLISDILVTDYSSCAGDFPLLGRAVYLYQPDREEYIEKDRTFYFDLDASPFWIAQTQEKLEEMAVSATEESIRDNDRAILDFFGTFESGSAREAVTDEIARVHGWKRA